MAFGRGLRSAMHFVCELLKAGSMQSRMVVVAMTDAFFETDDKDTGHFSRALAWSIRISHDNFERCYPLSASN